MVPGRRDWCLLPASLPLSSHQDLQGLSLGLSGSGTAVYTFPSLITMIYGFLNCRIQVWIVGRVLCAVDCGLLVCGSDRLAISASVVCGFWSVGCGLWTLGCGSDRLAVPWSVGCRGCDHELWAVVYGLRVCVF